MRVPRQFSTPPLWRGLVMQPLELAGKNSAGQTHPLCSFKKMKYFLQRINKYLFGEDLQ